MADQLDRIENAIERLAEISTDMKTMLAAHEQRLNQSEKDTNVLFKLAENRRKEYDMKIDEVYTHMNDKDDKILAEIKAHREASAKEHESLSKRITVLEKYIWLAIGAAAVISSIMPYFLKMIVGH
jgi:RecA-family ATPase